MKHLSLCLAGLLLSISPLAATTIVNDTLSDASKTDGPDASNVVWYVAGATSYTYNNASDGKLSLSSGTASGQFLGYFPSVTLASGDTLTASFVYSFSSIGTATGNTVLRVGLYNSDGATKTTADGWASAAAFQPYDGYAGMSPVLSSATGTTSIYEKTVVSNALIATVGNWTAIGTGASTTTPMVANTSYTGTFSITNNAGTLDFVYNLTDGSAYNVTALGTDASPTALTFDTVCMLTAGNAMLAGGIFSLDSFAVTVTAVPEPSTYAIIFGLGALGVVMARRRSRRSSGA